MGIQKISHEGQTIFYLDFSNLKFEEDILKQINECTQEIRKQPYNSLITLTNVSGMQYNKSIMDSFSDFISGNKPYVKTGAVFGLTGLSHYVYNGLMKVTGRDVRSFKLEIEAKDFLIGK
jgi:hypothetical protein